MVNVRQRRWVQGAAALAALGAAVPAHAASLAEAWGYNAYGQVGNGTISNSTTPVTATGLASGVTAVAGGGNYSLAVRNGGVYAWGLNNSGQLGTGTTNPSTTPVALTGNLSSGVTAIAGGALHSLAVRNGGVYAWGLNSDGQLGTGTTTNSTTPVALAGTLSSGVTAIAGGAYHSLAVRNGGVYAWGFNYYGQLGTGTTTNSTTPVALAGNLSSGVTAIAGGAYHSLAVRNGGVYAWGLNNNGQLGTGTTTNSTTPVALAGTLSSGVTAIAGGDQHSLAVRNGGVYAWGYNGNGQLGTGTTTSSTTPVAVSGITGTITAVAASANNSYALAADGSLWDWGINDKGQPGLGTTASLYTTPQHLLAPAGYAYTSVSANSIADHAVTTLARPDAAIGSTATGPVLGTVAPAGSDAAGYTTDTLVLSGLTISGSVQINGNLAASAKPVGVSLKLDDPTQAAALIADLNALYGAGTATATAGTYQVLLTLPTSAGSPDYFNFDFTTVVGAGIVDPLGTGGREVGSVGIDALAVTAAPEPTSLLLLGVAAPGLLGRRRRRRC